MSGPGVHCSVPCLVPLSHVCFLFLVWGTQYSQNKLQPFPERIVTWLINTQGILELKKKISARSHKKNWPLPFGFMGISTLGHIYGLKSKLWSVASHLLPVFMTWPQQSRHGESMARCHWNINVPSLLMDAEGGSLYHYACRKILNVSSSMLPKSQSQAGDFFFFCSGKKDSEYPAWPTQVPQVCLHL